MSRMVRGDGPKAESAGSAVRSTIVVTDEERQDVLEAFDFQDMLRWLREERRLTLLSGKVMVAWHEHDVEFDFDARREPWAFKMINPRSKAVFCRFTVDPDAAGDELAWDLDHVNMQELRASYNAGDDYPTVERYAREVSDYARDAAAGRVGQADLDRAVASLKENFPEEDFTGSTVVEIMQSAALKFKNELASLDAKWEDFLEGECVRDFKFFVALMKRFVDVRPREVAGGTRERILEEGGVPRTYKYNGKVYVADNRVYKLTTTLAEKREFTRHIGRWVVRGHWRRYRNEDGSVKDTVWIEEYEKGEGRPEERTYVMRTKKKQ